MGKSWRTASRISPALLFIAVTFVAVTLAVACGSRAGGPSVVDCGSFDARHDGYDTAGRECVWNAYMARQAVRWSVTGLTIEGDPIPGTLSFDPVQGIVVTRDTRADQLSASAQRRVDTWRCATMTKKIWATDASRYSFELAGCRGDGDSAHFP